MIFNQTEKDILYQFATDSKQETLERLQEIVPRIKHDETKDIIKGTIEKLSVMPEKECVQFIKDIKKISLQQRDDSIQQRLAKAKEQTKQPNIRGHDLNGMERFMDDTRHMIILDVTSDESPVGQKGERYRFFLSDAGYYNAVKSEQRREIKIKSHAFVKAGKIIPEKIQKNERI